MGLLKIFLYGVFTLMVLTLVIYNFFIPKINQTVIEKKIRYEPNYFKNYKKINDKIDEEEFKEYKVRNFKKDLYDNNKVNNFDKKIENNLNEKKDNFFDLGFINNDEEAKIKEDGFQNYSFNLLISNRIGLKRNIPDTRHKKCDLLKYSNVEELPKSSIIICFFNEALSTLFRTIQSILDRTDEELIEEILLINDFSNNKEIDDIKLKIKEFEDKKVKLINLPERSGLIRAKAFGAKKAKGEILVYLDSHCEVNKNWLIPLLDAIKNDSKLVALPIIDLINAYTFEYSSSLFVKGGFNWGMNFKWDSVSNEPIKNEDDFVKPFSSPTMAGGLFAIRKDYFFEMGSYDEQMDIWGGENLEMSFRIWMCGGKLKVIPCSRVGHVFRLRRPYGSPDGIDHFSKNSLRVVNVWLDEFKEYFYNIRKDLKNFDYGDINDRLKLREKLNCKNFKWYINNIYPEMKAPNVNSLKKLDEQKQKVIKLKPKLMTAKGRVVNRFQIELSGSKFCVESKQEVTVRKTSLLLNKCASIKRQLWSETDTKQLILADFLCMDSESKNVYIEKCTGLGESQNWKHSGQRNAMIYNSAAGLCLGVKFIRKNEPVILTICGSEEAKKWNFVTRMI